MYHFINIIILLSYIFFLEGIYDDHVCMVGILFNNTDPCN